jgi:hypothetical protein
MRKRAQGWRRLVYPANRLAAWHSAAPAKTAFPRVFLPGLSAPTGWFTRALGAHVFPCFTFRAGWLAYFPSGSAGGLSSRGVAVSVFHRFCRGLGSWVVAKLKYKGKSFRWYRKRGALVLRFGHSHLVTMAAPLLGSKWRRKGRMKILFFGSNYYELRHFLSRVIRWRPMNLYHGRGLRFSRQVVFRKAGKVSAYR